MFQRSVKLLFTDHEEKMNQTVVRQSLMCEGPTAFEVQLAPRRQPTANEMEVAATSVNPIDARRAEGYGRRLLSLFGAGRLPLVLGNDFPGIVTSVGSKVANFKPGDRVFGVKRTSSDGAHASHIIVKATPEQVRIAAGAQELRAIAAIPYNFVSMWLAVRDAGLTKGNAAGKSVLVHGAAGGLGTLALQMLSTWEASCGGESRLRPALRALEARLGPR
jgi:reticulon-4-interacting protein 1, mitochondrial